MGGFRLRGKSHALRLRMAVILFLFPKCLTVLHQSNASNAEKCRKMRLYESYLWSSNQTNERASGQASESGRNHSRYKLLDSPRYVYVGTQDMKSPGRDVEALLTYFPSAYDAPFAHCTNPHLRSTPINSTSTVHCQAQFSSFQLISIPTVLSTLNVLRSP